MTEYFEEVAKALRMWTRVNPFLRVILWLLWFLSFQLSAPSRFIMFMFNAIFTVVIGGFECVRLNEQ